MLDDRQIRFEYREYTQNPLTAVEIREVLSMLGVGPRGVLRRNDRVYRELGLQGSESDEAIVELMAEHPTLLQRPIAILDGRAVLGRPPERLLELVG